MTAFLAALGINLALLLSMLGAPPIDGSEEMTVVFESGAPGGPEIRGRACGPSLIVPGDKPNPLCHGLPDNTMIIHPDVLNGPKYADGNPASFRVWLLRTLAHEACHFDPAHFSPDLETPWEQYHEAECYAVEEPYIWKDWLQRSNTVRYSLVKGER